MDDFQYPSKKIFDSNDVNYFKRSLAYNNIQDTIKSIVVLVKSHDVPKDILNPDLVTRLKPTTTTNTTSTTNNKLPPKFHQTDLSQTHIKQELNPSCKNVEVLVNIFRDLNQLITDTPPIEGPRRFGNYAFKDWFNKLEQQCDKYLEGLDIKTIDKLGFIKELKYYLLGAFGSNVRLDYGTGHELSFVAVIGALLRFKLLTNILGPQMLMIFALYYDVVRRLILTYSLEPAGSHGVWGLDDHFHFIYILGAAQFNEASNKMVPQVGQCLNDSVLHDYSCNNLYINAIGFIKKIKIGPFNEHSPILFDIHNSVHLWKKVLSGLLKMYDVEVLGKFPVVQHFWFGNVLYPWKDINFNNLPLNPLHNKETTTTNNESNEETNHGPEFLNGSGVRTTSNTISMTGAPWLRNKTTNPRAQINQINQLNRSNNNSTNPRANPMSNTNVRMPPKFNQDSSQDPSNTK